VKNTVRYLAVHNWLFRRTSYFRLTLSCVLALCTFIIWFENLLYKLETCLWLWFEICFDSKVASHLESGCCRNISSHCTFPCHWVSYIDRVLASRVSITAEANRPLKRKSSRRTSTLRSLLPLSYVAALCTPVIWLENLLYTFQSCFWFESCLDSKYESHSIVASHSESGRCRSSSIHYTFPCHGVIYWQVAGEQLVVHSAGESATKNTKSKKRKNSQVSSHSLVCQSALYSNDLTRKPALHIPILSLIRKLPWLEIWYALASCIALRVNVLSQ